MQEHMEVIICPKGYLIDTRIKAGCAIKHTPTGEEWVLLGVRKKTNQVCAMGWPPTMAQLSDCVFIEDGVQLTDEQKIYRREQFGECWDE